VEQAVELARAGTRRLPGPTSGYTKRVMRVAPTQSTAVSSRIDALDRLRGAALVGMLVHHFVGWLTGGDARAVIPGWPSFAITDTAAPAFFVAAGMSTALFVASRRRRAVSRPRVGAQILRRYGLLVPLGMGLRWVLWRSPFGFGVLEALGLAVLAAAAIVLIVPRRLAWASAVAMLMVGVLAERASQGQHDWVALQLVGGKFPAVTYVGFVLVGMAVVQSGRYTDRRWVAGAALVAILAVVALLIDGIVPDRYPGDLPFVVPGLAGTILVYALGQYRWPPLLAPVDRLLRAAAAHTLGIFLFHYALYAALRQAGVNGTVGHVLAVPAAVGLTVALCVIAPFVPQLPWSLRTGRRQHPAGGQRTVLAVRSQPEPPSPVGEEDAAGEGGEVGASPGTIDRGAHRVTGEVPGENQ